MKNYDEQFLGVRLPLPKEGPTIAASVLRSPELREGKIADYPNYAVVTDADKRTPLYAVLMIDQNLLREAPRTDRWKIDSRIGAEYQLDNAYYANNPWDRGHMARRKSAAWGATNGEAKKSSDETFYYSNACLQHANVNQDEWLGLEDWALTVPTQNGRVVEYSGPVFGDSPRTLRPAGREPAEVPAGFFKIVCYVGRESKELEVRAFLVFQDAEAIADKDGRKIYDFQHYQVTVREIEELTGLEFPDEVYERNPLFFYENDDARAVGVRSFPERVDVGTAADLVEAKDARRIPVVDDLVDVFIVAAQPAPQPGNDEWVSLTNLGADEISIDRWTLRDRHQRDVVLAGTLASGESLRLTSTKGLGAVKLPNDGGLLKLLNDRGEQVDHVDYTKRDLRTARGRPLVFSTYRRE